MSDIELGQFIRTHREATSPADVGLAVGQRRRTPGLRRSELAMLAGISVEYLTRIEQGRDRHPSSQVLGAIAAALRLSTAEQELLARAAKSSSGLCPAAAPPARQVRPTVRALLDKLEPAPAVLVNRLLDVVAHTAGYERLTGPLGLLDAQPPNLLRYLFGDPRARAAFPDWDAVADHHVRRLQLSASRDDPHLAALVDELGRAGGAAFTERFAAVPGVTATTGIERLAHPAAGPLRLAYETLELAGTDDLQVVVYFAGDDPTSAALDRLVGREPRALRAVSG